MRLCLICAIGGGFLAAGCDSRSGTGNPQVTPSQKMDVLATVYPLAEMIQQIGGDRVNVQWLAEGGQRPEDIEVDAALKQRANKAALVVTSGSWDMWTVTELSSEVRAARLVEPGSMPAALGADPKSYLWLNPAVMRELGEAMRVRLTVIDAAHDVAYRQSAQAFQTEVDAVDREVREGLAPLAKRTVLTVRPVWGAFCARYGLTQETADFETKYKVVGSGKIETDATEGTLMPEDFKALARAAKRANTKTLFIDVNTSAGVRQQIEARTGLNAVTLDAMGTSAPDGRSTWAKIMRYNLSQLKKGLE